jgi:hypothetical protein
MVAVERRCPYAELSRLRLAKQSSKTSLLARTCGKGDAYVPHRGWSTVIAATVANQDELPSAHSPLAALLSEPSGRKPRGICRPSGRRALCLPRLNARYEKVREGGQMANRESRSSWKDFLVDLSSPTIMPAFARPSDRSCPRPAVSLWPTMH